MNIIDHVEKYLGLIDAGWTPRGLSEDVSVSRFLNQPVEEISTYVTFGLSDHKLSMPNGKSVRQEFIFSTLESVPGEEVAGLLLRMADLIMSRKKAILRGEVIGPGREMFSGSSMNAIYVSIPVMFDEKFATFEGTLPSTVLVWLIPILSNEAKYIEEHGWEEFEDVLEQNDPDLWDLGRQSVITPSA